MGTVGLRQRLAGFSPVTFEAPELSEHLEPLYRYALGVTRDPDLAADVVQDTIVRALERRAQYRSDAPLGHWLMRIAHNLIIDKGRRAGREVPADELSIESIERSWSDDAYTVDAAEVVERAATRAELLDALVRLPFIYRSAVVLHDIEGLRVADIAEIQDVSLPAAKQRLRRGRMAMVSALAAGADRDAATRGVPMNCWDARTHVSDYMNGDLDAVTADLIESHLRVCPTCPPLYAALVGLQSAVGKLRDPDTVIDPQTEERIRTRLHGKA